MLLVYQGTADDGAAFFERLWPTVRAVADPDSQLYRAFGIERGRPDQLFSAGVLACSLRAALKGNLGGRPQGDSRLLPGLLLVAGDTILWRHTYRHVGDHPDFATIPAHLPPVPAN